MRISRRNLLLQLGSQFPALIVLPSVTLADLPFKSFQIVLTDVTAVTPPEGLLAILETFVKARIPISCVVTPKSDARILRPDSTLAQHLRRLIVDYPALIEVVLLAPKLTERPFYFQARLATQARQDLHDGLSIAQTDRQLSRSVLTVANYGTSARYDPSGIRAAGFRTVLSLPRSGIEPVDSDWHKGVLHIFGGMHFNLFESFELIEEALSVSVRDDARTLLALSIEGLNTENMQSVVLRMTKIAALITALAETGQIAPTNPTEFHIRSTPDTDTVIGLRLDVLGAPDDPISALTLAFVESLQAENFAFTFVGEWAPSWRDFGEEVCSQNRRDLSDSHILACVIGNATPDTQTVSTLAPRIELAAFPELETAGGVDWQATFRPPRYAFVDAKKPSQQSASRIKTLEDTVIVLDQRSYNSVAQRQKTMGLIRGLSARSGFQIADVATYVEKVQPLEPIRLIYHQTKEVMHTADRTRATIEPPDRDLILGDAVLAWSYFKRFSNAKTGLIPTTVFATNTEDTLYNYATTWDVGSQIFGMIAAVELDLLTLPELNAWAERIVSGLPTVKIQGLELPSSVIHIAGAVLPRQSFNACDVGRLLNAFNRLRSFSPELKNIIEQKVAGWSLQATILDGRLQDLTDDRTRDRFISHCTTYAARGYAAFGINAKGSYVSLNGRTDADVLMELLFDASKIGSLGAEPMLLEGVELGFSPETKFLADMLFAAQLEDNRATGAMRCVSEVPLNKAPWFSYHGYNLNDFADSWVVQVISTDTQFTNPDFLRSIEMVSVKAAYLWAATHPHQYSHALVDYVRPRAQINGLGFSSGISLESGLPIEDFSDINTNGVILEATAHILKS